MGSICYNVQELANLSGVSVRTLHYYDQIGLLQPMRGENNYRQYGIAEVDHLQQILLYRKVGVGLKDIKRLLDDESFVVGLALQSHLSNLKEQQHQIESLIASVEKTLACLEGTTTMEDKEKFEGLKRDLINKNEKQFGAEIRERYGDDEIDASNAKLAGMSKGQWERARGLEQLIKDKLLEAIERGEGPDGLIAQEACDLHRQWLNAFWKEGMYSKERHKGLADAYEADNRFKDYYEQIAPGAAHFFREAVTVYCSSSTP